MTMPAFDYFGERHEVRVRDYLDAGRDNDSEKLIEIMKALEMCRNDIVIALQDENDVEMRQALKKIYEGVAIFIAYLKHEESDADAFEEIHLCR